MTPQEAADLVVTCTAPGLSGAPLWEFLPGMLTLPWQTADGRFMHPAWRVGDPPREWPSVYFAERTCRWEEDARPDFTDELTVQALYLLVVRAYPRHALAVFRGRDPLDDALLPPGAVRLIIVDPAREDVFSLAGPAYAVFARALAAAPTNPSTSSSCRR